MSLDKIKEIVYDLKQQVMGLPVHRYGTIASLEPLTLVLDGERGTILEPYKNCSVKVGDRVSCLRQGTQTIILAVVGGRDPNTIVVNGVEYARSGSTVASGGTWVDAGLPGWAYVTKTAQQPYTPPDGWHFLIFPVDNFDNFIWGTQASPGSMSMRLFGSIKAATVRCDWLLIKD